MRHQNENQQTLFEVEPSWKKLWLGMPEYDQDDLMPWRSILVHFRDRIDQHEFASLVGQTITNNTKSIWYPKAEIESFANKRYATKKPVTPRYPVYIISKGRWKSPLTARALDLLGVPYSIVVEPQEHDDYAAVVDPTKILTLPFSNLGQGSIPARNYVWEHSITIGAKRHWILDDNMSGFYRLTKNLKTPVSSGAIFLAAEDFSDRYTNVALSGFNYFMFAKRKYPIPPFVLNTRIYSCILVKNDIPYRWRGKYNEDTDLSLRALKDGWCTVLFNAFLVFKKTTMSMGGGNTDELYQGNGRLSMAQSLQEQHPDVVKITQKWGRWQHQVNYVPFKKNKLVQRKGVTIPDGENNYGMEIQLLNNPVGDD